MTFVPEVFRIVSWNMQGALGTDKASGKIKDKLTLLHEYMQDEQVIAICLQECGDLFGWWQGYKKLAETFSKEKMNALISKKQRKDQQLEARFGEIGKNGDFLKINNDWADPVRYPQRRCSVGILVRKRFYTGSEIALLDWQRAVIGARLYGFNQREPFFIYSIHVPYEKRDPIYIKNMLEYISTQFLKTHGDNHRGSWICAGDFNFSPNPERPELQSFAPHLRRPGLPTTINNEFDYGYLGGSYLPLLGCSVHVQQQFQYSDHRPVHFLFSPRYVINKHAADLASKLNPQSPTRLQLYINGNTPLPSRA